MNPIAPDNTSRLELRLTGLDCPDCARGVAASVEALSGVTCASLNFATGILIVEYDDASVPSRVVSLVRKMDYGLEPIGGAAHPELTAPSLRMRLVEPAIYAAGVLILAGWGAQVMGWAPMWSLAASLTALVLSGGPVLRRGLVSARARILDMNVLMSLAVIGALALGDHREAATVVFLFAIGGALESRSLARTRRSIRDLASLSPDTVHVMRDGVTQEVPTESVAVGEMVLVKPGARIPVDGQVASGSSAVDEAPITGESLPVLKGPGARVFAGSLNGSGALEAVVTSAGNDSTISRIVRLVEDAQATQAPIQGLVDRFTRWYTPVVLGLALAIASLPPVVLWVTGNGFEPREWVYRALVLLVVSCPCALVISTPVAVVSAITRAARDGVLVKGGAFIEMAARIRVVAFDKTGTLTVGRPEVSSVLVAAGSSAAEVLGIAASLESRASHPLAAAVLRAAEGTHDDADEVDEVAGRGVFGDVRGTRYLAGSPALARESGIDAGTFEQNAQELEALGQTVIVVADVESCLALGVIGVEDVIRDHVADVMNELRIGGIAHTVMLTGDHERVGAAVAHRAGVDEFRASLLPQDKSEAVRALSLAYGPLAMVGDGINDAPALAVADIGIAMGAAGSDTALETADVALMSDDLSALPGFFDLGRRTLVNIRQNVWFSVVVKFVVLVLALTGYASLWLAVFADTGVALLVILNGLRLLRPTKRLPIST
ncbi:MAG: cation-translocating P-type ATPase [Actinobacteria bacterium]|nr:cation-translocating P-type ATPase [Actinomycetota bacterium]MCG2807570.1 cation-translocating P-type ATPase [Coriobacteriia bacterium]